MDSHTTGIIPTVFETLEPLNKNRNDVALSYRCDDPTHGKPL